MKRFSLSRHLVASWLVLAPAVTLLVAASAQADPITPEVQVRVDKAKKKLQEWVANPTIIAAAKDSNAKGGIAGMTNAKWDELNESDPAVKGLQASAAGKLCKQWETEEKGVNKVTVFDEKGNVAASSTKTLLYNAGNRPAIVGALKGAVWQSPDAKPDPTTQKKSVNISAPIKDGGKVIGLMNAAVDAE